MNSSNFRNGNDIYNDFIGSNPHPFERNLPNISNTNLFGRSSPNISPNGSTGFGSGCQRVFCSDINWKTAALEYKLSCSLEELYSGSTRKMKISRNVLHPNNFGTMKLVKETEIIPVKVKPGWKKGTNITFANKGNQDLNGHFADVIFAIDEKPHEIFIRDDNDLVLNHKLSLADALAGTTVNLKTLDGRDLLVPVNEIVTPGYEIVVAGEGMPISKNPGGVKGNLKIKFEVKFPARLSPVQKRAIRRDLGG